MTLPLNTILPLHSERIKEGGKSLDHYMRELIFTLQRQYEDVAQAVNGDFRRSVDAGNNQWTPVLRDTANAGTTFTYDHQVGTVLRKGLIVDAWFDVEWTAATGATTGNMYLELPYEVAISEEKPFVGSLQTSVFTYTGGTQCVVNAIPNTYRLEVWNVGSGFTTANQSSGTAGHLLGHIRYVGQGIERS